MGVPEGNLSLPLLTWGIFLALAAVLLAFPTRIFLSEYSIMSGGFEFFTTNLAYAMAMFASKLVEEEHRFWYYAAPLWLAYMGFQRYATATPNTRH